RRDSRRSSAHVAGRPRRPAVAEYRAARCSAARRLARTVAPRMRPTFWKARARPATARWWGARSVMSTPRNRTRPVSGGRNPLMTSNSVVLPAPLGPMIPTISSSLTASETPRSARTPPKLTEQSSTSSTARHPGPGDRRLDRPQQLAEPAGIAGEREQQQQRAEDQRRQFGGQVGNEGDGVDGGGQVQL